MLGKTIFVAALSAALCVTAMDAQAKDVKVGVVVKIGGIPWFNAMENGIKEKCQGTRRRRLHGRADQR